MDCTTCLDESNLPAQVRSVEAKAEASATLTKGNTFMTSARDVSADKRSERPKPIARRRLKVSDIDVVDKPMLKKAR
jgi:hypothetical protein